MKDKTWIEIGRFRTNNIMAKEMLRNMRNIFNGHKDLIELIVAGRHWARFQIKHDSKKRMPSIYESLTWTFSVQYIDERLKKIDLESYLHDIWIMCNSMRDVGLIDDRGI